MERGSCFFVVVCRNLEPKAGSIGRWVNIKFTFNGEKNNRPKSRETEYVTESKYREHMERNT